MLKMLFFSIKKDYYIIDKSFSVFTVFTKQLIYKPLNIYGKITKAY